MPARECARDNSVGTRRYPAPRPWSSSALRISGLVFGVAIIAYALWRRGSLRNGDKLLLLAAGLGVMIVSATELPDAILAFFSFSEGGGGRILGLSVFAIIVLFLLVVRGQLQNGRIERKLSAALEGIAWDEFRAEGLPERFRDKVAVVIPAYNEADNIGQVLPRIPTRVCGAETGGARRRRRLSRRDRRGGAQPRRRGRAPRDEPRRRCRPADGLPADDRLRGHGSWSPWTPTASTCPRRWRELVQPVLDGEVLVAHGSRVLGQADANHFAREMGIIFFNRLVSLITRTKVTDCSNGYRAVSTAALPQLVLRQEQFHTSEFMIEAIKRGVPAIEVPVTVVSRLHGHSKKPAVFRYGWGFTNAIMRTWLR